MDADEEEVVAATESTSISDFIDPDEAPAESKLLAEQLYHGIHPALEAIGMTYAGASRDVKVELTKKAARLRAVLDYDEQKIAAVLNIIFGR